MMPGIEERHKKIISETRVFQKEVEANKILLPKLREFAGDRKISLVSTPQLVHGSYDDEGAGILVFVDMNDDGQGIQCLIFKVISY